MGVTQKWGIVFEMGGGVLTPLRTMQRLPNVFREYEKEALAWNELKCITFWQIVNMEVMFGNLKKHSDFKCANIYSRGKYGSRYSTMDWVKLVEDSLWKIWSDMACLSSLYQFKFFRGCLPQIFLGPFLNTLKKQRRIQNAVKCLKVF